MGNSCFCVIDVGTGGVKCLVFDEKGQLVFKDSSPIDFRVDGKAISFDPAAVWNNVCKMTRRAVRQCSTKGKKIVSVTSTSMREGNVFYDASETELLAVPNLDKRAEREAETIQASLGDEIYLTSGHWPSSMFLVSRLKFLQNSEPALFGRIKTVSMINDWILFKFSGKFATEPTNGCESALFSLKERSWSGELIKECHFDRSLFPEEKECGMVLGQISYSSSRKSGLDRSTTVVVGAADTECAVLGCGVLEPGNTVIIAGTTTPIQSVVDVPFVDSLRRTWTCCHIVPNRWTVESNAGGTGLVFKWWSEMTGLGFSELDREVEMERPSPGKIWIRIGTSLMDARHPHPITGNIENVTPWTSRSEITLGIIEACCFSVRANLEQLENVLGTSFPVPYLCGGSSKSKVWRELQSSILGRKLITLSLDETTGRGAAMLSAVACGFFSNLGGASKSFLKRRIAIKPDSATFETYEPFYQRWLASAAENSNRLMDKAKLN